MGKVAIIVSRGSFNNLVQVATLIRALTTSPDTSVRVMFRDEAVLKVTKARINEPDFSEPYRGLEEATLMRLQAAEFEDLRTFFRDSKQHGDDVKLYACTSSMFMCGVTEEDLIPEIDGPMTLSQFLQDEVEPADHLMTF